MTRILLDKDYDDVVRNAADGSLPVMPASFADLLPEDLWRLACGVTLVRLHARLAPHWRDAQEIHDPTTPTREELELAAAAAEGRPSGLPLKTIGVIEVYDAADYPDISNKLVVQDCEFVIDPDLPLPFRAYVDLDTRRVVAVHVQLRDVQVRPTPGP